MLASGAGTNLQAILDQLHGRDGVRGGGGRLRQARTRRRLERAAAAGVETEVFARADGEDREARDAVMAAWLAERKPDLIVLAGYMQLLSPPSSRPSSSESSTCTRRCCPRSRGSTRPAGARPRRQGHRGHRPLRRRGRRLGTDHPPAGDRDSRRAAVWDHAEEQIHAVEHELLPEAIRLIAAGRVSLDPGQPPSREDLRMSTEVSKHPHRQRRRARRDPRAPGADLGLRQDRRRRLRAAGLRRLGVEIVSTGGTEAALREAGIEVQGVEELTGFPEILDGRVKTLHPHLHAALLAERDDPEHVETLAERGIEPIDLVCVNLYPFERTVAREGVPDSEAIENIDVGGPTMIRAAAKNHRDVAVVVKPECYDAVLAELEESGGEVSATTRHWLANEAFAQTARYDAAISSWFAGPLRGLPDPLGLGLGEDHGPLLRREPAPAGGALRRLRRPLARPLAHGEAARQAALLQQRPRPRRRRAGCSPTSTSRPA